MSQKVSQKRLKLTWKAIYEYLLDYCQDTTIHGFKYIGDTSRPWIERIFWMIAFVFSTIGCALLISEMFEKLRTNPITVSLAERPNSISDIPFPAVTICPEVQTTFSDSESEFDFKEIVNEGKNFDFESLSEIDKSRLQALSFICNKPEYLKKVQFSESTEKLIEVMKSFTNEKWFVEQSASWSKIYAAPFAKTLTPFGFCFTFNILNASDLLSDDVSRDFFYTRDLKLFKKEIKNFSASPKSRQENPLKTFPWSATVSDQDSGFTAALKSDNRSKGWFCSRYEGFRYFIHGTNELLSSTNRFQLQFGELTELLIKPKMTITEEDLKSYSLERRNCYFDEERELKFFKQYTKYNCEQECLSNFTKSKCGCVKFSVIRDKLTQICAANQMDCFDNAENELFNGEISNEVDEKEKYKELSKCRCYPQCGSLKYELELVKTNYKAHLTEFMNVASLKVFYKNNEFVALKRFQLYGTVDFLANCGGLLGLFVGVSVLSIVEIFYYFTLRLICILKDPTNVEENVEEQKNEPQNEKQDENLRKKFTRPKAAKGQRY